MSRALRRRRRTSRVDDCWSLFQACGGVLVRRPRGTIVLSFESLRGFAVEAKPEASLWLAVGQVA